MKDIRMSLIAGIDIPIPQCQIILHQPKIKEIALIGEDNFFIGLQCLNINKKLIQVQGEVLTENINNFQIFMMVMTDQNAIDKKKIVQQIFDLIFPGYKTIFTPRTILFTKEGQDNIILDESNFNYFQEVIQEVFCLKSQAMSSSGVYNPADAKAQEIAEKLARGRQRVAAQTGEAKSSMFSQYVSILTVGLKSMSLQNCLDLTMYQMLDLVERYSLYTNWDIDVRARLAGASPDEQPDNWMKNIH